jgi:hypothetical protein
MSSSSRSPADRQPSENDAASEAVPGAVATEWPDRLTTAELTAEAEKLGPPSPEEIAAAEVDTADGAAAAAAALAHSMDADAEAASTTGDVNAPPSPDDVAGIDHDVVDGAEAAAQAFAPGEPAPVPEAEAETAFAPGEPGEDRVQAAARAETEATSELEDAAALVFESADSAEIPQTMESPEELAELAGLAELGKLPETVGASAQAAGEAPADDVLDDADMLDDDAGRAPPLPAEASTEGAEAVDALAASASPAVEPPVHEDEEFLRRVVLPTELRAIIPGSGALPAEPMSLAESQDRTVISDPPSPEILAAMAAPLPPVTARPAAAFAGWNDRQHADGRRWQLHTWQLGGLLLAAAIGGGAVAGLVRPRATGDAVVETAAMVPLSPPPPAAVVPTITPLPPQAPGAAPQAAAPAVAAVPAPPAATPPAVAPTGPEIRPISRPASVGKRTTSVRRNASKRAPKKEFVDPFQ